MHPRHLRPFGRAARSWQRLAGEGVGVAALSIITILGAATGSSAAAISSSATVVDSATRAAGGSITVVIEMGEIKGAARIVIDLETSDLQPIPLSMTVDGARTALADTPFGSSAVVNASADGVTIVVDGADGDELRLTATYIDADGTRLAHAARRVTLAPAAPGPGPQPSPGTTPGATPQPTPGGGVVTLEPTPSRVVAAGQVATTGGSVPWPIIGVGAAALAAGAAVVLISRKRVQA